MSQAKKIYLIDRLSQLGDKLNNPDEALRALIETEQHYNAWFTPLNTMNAVKAIGGMLNREDLAVWLSPEPGARSPESEKPAQDSGLQAQGSKNVGLILAGNIPLVGFHDVLCVLVSRHHAMIKASTQDARLIKHLLNMLVEIAPEFAGSFSFVERLANFDAVIATGSNNTSRYFEYYFGKVPHIIRKNRNSVTVLTGIESTEQLFLLGHDIFDFFGLGCRNVSKLWVPKAYDFVPFFEAIEPHADIINHHKYRNNYDYNKSIYLVNGDKHLDNGFLLVKEDERLASPLAVLYFEYYNDLDDAQIRLAGLSEQIQCIVSETELHLDNQVVGFGESQKPKLWDYADGVDTMAFLNTL
ncbi:acyl-CoA reductase [Mucilaginibacter sp. PPCGB 2223]|uniref:acyl-CoA reductase n=1 Tax=Mucilaginibacter sp. PPCGB 2223 TaxID=1886027 RepID=UPI000825BFA5|nr:acyl-CoA reductase [Mucilaginibacter sp. PPCGB 2223]OCX53618.1 acyl-CoA reductase [Mucilaginibacter sp. PPCGB 2223]